ncbi:MAG: DUF4358 domain-containing protein [Sarcina sp.]
MKKILVCTLVAIISFTGFVACGDKGDQNTGADKPISQEKEVNLKEEFAKLESEFTIRMPGDVSEEELREIYEINMDNVEDFSIKQCMMTPGVEVLGIFKAKDGKEADVKKDLEKILAVKKNAAYLPEEMDALENARIETSGDYACIFILQGDEEGNTGRSDKALESFKSVFK